MPHLSPLNWAIAIPLFLTFALIILSIFSWTQVPILKFQPQALSNQSLFSKWSWL